MNTRVTTNKRKRKQKVTTEVPVAASSGVGCQTDGTVSEGTDVVLHDNLQGGVQLEKGVTGSSTSIEYLDQPVMLTSVASELGVTVQSSIRDKIISCKYVELGTLLITEAQCPETSNQLVMSDDGSVVVKPKEAAAKKIVNIENWTDAFIIFTSVYLSAHPHRAQELLKYMHSIRLGYSRHGGMGWKIYDEQFRLRMAYAPSMKWSDIDNELWLVYMVQPSKMTGSVDNSPRKKCFDFNFRGSCSKPLCNYVHACINCNASHPQVTCNLNSIRSPRYTQPFVRSQSPIRARGSYVTHGTQRPLFRPRAPGTTNSPRFVGPRVFPS